MERRKQLTFAMNGFEPGCSLFHSNIQDDNENQNKIHINIVVIVLFIVFTYEQGHHRQIGTHLTIC